MDLLLETVNIMDNISIVFGLILSLGCSNGYS